MLANSVDYDFAVSEVVFDSLENCGIEYYLSDNKDYTFDVVNESTDEIIIKSIPIPNIPDRILGNYYKNHYERVPANRAKLNHMHELINEYFDTVNSDYFNEGGSISFGNNRVSYSVTKDNQKYDWHTVKEYDKETKDTYIVAKFSNVYEALSFAEYMRDTDNMLNTDVDELF